MLGASCFLSCAAGRRTISASRAGRTLTGVKTAIGRRRARAGSHPGTLARRAPGRARAVRCGERGRIGRSLRRWMANGISSSTCSRKARVLVAVRRGRLETRAVVHDGVLVEARGRSCRRRAACGRLVRAGCSAWYPAGTAGASGGVRRFGPGSCARYRAPASGPAAYLRCPRKRGRPTFLEGLERQAQLLDAREGADPAQVLTPCSMPPASPGTTPSLNPPASSAPADPERLGDLRPDRRVPLYLRPRATRAGLQRFDPSARKPVRFRQSNRHGRSGAAPVAEAGPPGRYQHRNRPISPSPSSV